MNSANLLLFNCLMKLNTYLVLFAVLNLLIVNCDDGNAPKTTPVSAPNPSDSSFKRILEYVTKLAEDKMKSSNLPAKQKIAGSLPDGYPDAMIEKARNQRDQKKKYNRIMRLPTEMYRMCVYPFAKINYSKWCANSFFGAAKKSTSCLHTFCQVCCDHISFIYQYAAEKNLIGELMQLNQEQGIKSINNIVDRSQIHSCKLECQVNIMTKHFRKSTKLTCLFLCLNLLEILSLEHRSVQL